MKKFLPTFILLVILSNVFIQSVSAQSRIPVSSFSTEVTASVGELYLSISGFISPYASVVLTMQDGTFLRASVADEKGNFYISQVLIKRGFSGFCLTAIDFKRLGESTTCIKFPPASANIIMNNIFLPPTLGLSRTEIAEGSTAIAFGYTMPNSIVTLKL
ncbi:MAG: hypothetical protein HYT83_04340, partial [Candidatus Levybacteria bacterium]|nr:hypothetical protein [Candidatus Levybacteria bacterium]